MTSLPDEAFRKLFKNDVHQTTERWRERTLQRLGTISGQWTAWVEKDKIPTSPGPRPRAPTKPSSDSLMALLKEQERQRLFNLRILGEPDLTLDEVPLPNDLDIWNIYEDALAVYQARTRSDKSPSSSTSEVRKELRVIQSPQLQEDFPLGTL